MFVSRDVRFIEDVFPFAAESPVETTPPPSTMEFTDLEFGIFEQPTVTPPTSSVSDERGSNSYPPLLAPTTTVATTPIVYNRRPRTTQRASTSG